MATHRVPIIGWQALPDNSGVCFPAKYDVYAANDVWKHLILAMEDNGTTKGGFYGGFSVPKNYFGSPVLVINWTADVTTGNVKWQIEYRTVAGNDANSLDQAGVEETATVTDAAPGAIHRQLVVGITLAANFAADEFVEYYFTIRGDDAATTIATTCLIHDLLFEYVDA